MRKIGTVPARLLPGVALALALFTAVSVARSSGAISAPAVSDATRHVVKTAKNKTLGKTILVTLTGRTLYVLTAEGHGKFICTTGACLSLWTPLVVAQGTTPTGAGFLATAKRPDGRTQVMYHGRPLYAFKDDRKPGDVKGNGFKDVGTWLAAAVGATKTSAPPPTSGGGGYSY